MTFLMPLPKSLTWFAEYQGIRIKTETEKQVEEETHLCTSLFTGTSHQRSRGATAFLYAQGVFTLGDAQSFVGLTSKIPPLGSMLKFDADVKNMTARHQRENSFSFQSWNTSS